jgi:hypothetical protein
MFGSRISWLILSVNNFNSLYAVALFQFITGQMGPSGLFILIRPLIVVGERLRLTYFPLCSCWLNNLLELTISLTEFWNKLVGSVFILSNWIVFILTDWLLFINLNFILTVTSCFSSFMFYM